MIDRSVEFPSRYRLVPTDDPDVFDLVAVPGQIVEEGTPLSKLTFLTDQTAQAMGFAASEDPTVNDALSRLAQKTRRAAAFYDSDFYLYMTGRHPILNAGPYNDYPIYTYYQIKDMFERSIALTGDAQTITLYDGGNL